MGLFGPPNVSALKEKGNVKGLIKALDYQKDWRIREFAARALGEIKDPEAIAPLITHLRDFAESVELTASEALAEIGEPAVNELIVALAEENKRKIISDTLVKIGSPAVMQLSEVVRKGLFKNIRCTAAKTLGKLQATDALDALVFALFDPDRDVRKSAAEALVEIGRPCVKKVKDTLASKVMNVEEAQDVLARIKTKSGKKRTANVRPD